MRHGFQIRVLGPIDLLTPEGAVPIGSHHLRALLGALAIAARHSASTAYLGHALWGETPPPSAEATLQSCVSRLRHLVGAESIVHEDHSYRLVVDTHQLDALVFERLLIGATEVRDDPVRCRELCREGLRLWRGPPFGDLAEDEAFQLEALRLDELRIATMELSLEAELALSHPDLVVGELESLVDEYPYRERLWQLLVEALLGDARRVEALRACQKLRRVLADVGLEPGDDLRGLEERILGDYSPR